VHVYWSPILRMNRHPSSCAPLVYTNYPTGYRHRKCSNPSPSIISAIQQEIRHKPWSLNTIKQHAADRIEQHCATSIRGDSTESYMPQSVQGDPESWVSSEWGIEKEFPSLEDMFWQCALN
jgi:hypothetical protein